MTPLVKYFVVVLIATLCALFMTDQTHHRVLTKEEILSQCNSSKKCRLLVEMGYHESRNQSDKGVVAVMSVVMNRASHPTKWPNTIRGVLSQRHQFTYKWDGSLKKGFTEKEQHTRIALLAHSVLSGGIDSPVEQATFYHTNRINPVWSRHKVKVAQIEEHIFFR